MNCREFQEQVVDHARAGTLGGTLDPSSRNHAAECETCAAWLAAEEFVAVGFEALRREDEKLQACPHLEVALLEKYREQPRARRPLRPVPGSRLRWWLSAAAVALALAAWFGVAERGPRETVPDSITLSVPVASGSEQQSVARSDRPFVAPSTSPENSQQARGASHRAEVAQLPPEAEASPTPTETPGDAIAADPEEPAGAASDPVTAAAVSQGTEVVTGFVPLTYAQWGSPAPEAWLVRVRLPSTALAYLGLPGVASNAPVEADVVLGQDGLAYAVRFVRPAAPLPPADRTDSQTRRY